MAVSESRFHKGILYEKLENGRVRCGVCQRKCVMAEGQAGFCQTRVDKGGDVYSTIYGIVSSVGADPIEKKPVYHYLPGSRSFSLGSLGCNFRCVFCQNWEIAHADGTIESQGQYVAPEEAVRLAKEYGCASISWTYNEPAIWLEYTVDCAKLAKEQGLRTIYVTNGYITPEGLEVIGPYLDVYRVDIKSYTDEFYQKLIKVPSAQGIRDVAVLAKKKWGMHVEAVTNVVPTWNDEESNLRAIARWIRQELGELTPWHVTRFFPCADLTNVPATPLSTLERAKRIGLEEGLKFVYIGNVVAEDDSTYCPKCKTRAIWRYGYSARVESVTSDGACANCGKQLGIAVLPR